MPIPEELQSKFVYGNRSNETFSLQTLNKWLKKVSRSLGYEGDLTSYFSRHMAARALYAKYGLERTRRTLGHRIRDDFIVCRNQAE